jgi:hypothetical protein
VNFFGTHFETSLTTSGAANPRISNGINLLLSGCHIYENENGTLPSMLDNPPYGCCSLLGNFFGIEGSAAWCSGAGNWRFSGNRQRWGGNAKITSMLTDVAQ